jgi:thiol-disulfide isomerase/thioredoxin
MVSQSAILLDVVDATNRQYRAREARATCAPGKQTRAVCALHVKCRMRYKCRDDSRRACNHSAFWGRACRAETGRSGASRCFREKVQLREYRGKVVVLNFWATWCGPCREEMPMMVEAAKTWAPKGIAFIAISLDDSKTKKDIPAFVSKYGVSFPVWTGANADDLQKLRMGDGVPDTAFVDAEGVIRFRVLGEIRRAELDERLAALTGAGAGTAPAELVNHMNN